MLLWRRKQPHINEIIGDMFFAHHCDMCHAVTLGKGKVYLYPCNVLIDKLGKAKNETS